LSASSGTGFGFSRKNRSSDIQSGVESQPRKRYGWVYAVVSHGTVSFSTVRSRNRHVIGLDVVSTSV